MAPGMQPAMHQQPAWRAVTNALSHLQMPEGNPALVKEGQDALKEAAAELKEALDLTLTQFQCFLQDSQNIRCMTYDI